MKKSTLILIHILAVGTLVYLLTQRADYYFGDSKQVHTDTCTVYDTVKITVPIPVDSVVVRYITDTLQVLNIVDSVVLHPGQDSVPVRIPITQRQYIAKDYRAWVSGYRPALDSIHIFHTNHTVTHTITPKPKRWGVGVQLGVGASGQGVYPYVGIGVSYNLLLW